MSHFHNSKRNDLRDTFSDTLMIYKPSITLNFRNIFLEYFQQNLSCTKLILQKKRNFSP